MTVLAEAIIVILLITSGIFGLVGSIGLVKLPDPMMRLHAPTKATTLGVGGVLIASMLYFLVFGGKPSFHELMITLFLFLTAPITAHFVAKAFTHRNLKPEMLSKPANDAEWAGLAPSEDAPAPAKSSTDERTF